MTSVLFSVFLLLQTAPPAAGVKVGKVGPSITTQLVVSRRVTGRLSVQGDDPAPSSFTLPLMPPGAGTPSALPAGATTSLTIRPQIDGSFRVVLPPGEYRVGAPLGLPPGYTLESITYGRVDLLQNPLKVSS